MSYEDKIRKEIMLDPENEKYTEKGIPPLFASPKKGRIAVVGQAPGAKAEKSQKYWDDASGVRLRQWMGVSDEEFYNSGFFTILPMDFYFPGKAKTGDLPPRRGFANKWHKKILDHSPNIELIILAGAYAQKHYLGNDRQKNLTETVKRYKAYLPEYFPIVHPSPLNGRWLKKNDWFEKSVVPDLQERVRHILSKE